MTKYNVNPNEDEILPNLLNSNSKKEIEEAEFEGFLYAEILLTTQLFDNIKFDLDYIKNIHYLALKDVYSFAGKYRTVNISKSGFMFPAARFLEESMKEFETDILNNLLDKYEKFDSAFLIGDIAKVHAELL